jgi:hypothetical protein
MPRVWLGAAPSSGQRGLGPRARPWRGARCFGRGSAPEPRRASPVWFSLGVDSAPVASRDDWLAVRLTCVFVDVAVVVAVLARPVARCPDAVDPVLSLAGAVRRRAPTRHATTGIAGGGWRVGTWAGLCWGLSWGPRPGSCHACTCAATRHRTTASDLFAEQSRESTVAATGVELIARGRYQVVAQP